MKIEAGKHYITRGGEKVGPIVGYGPLYGPVNDPEGWYENGRRSAIGESVLDLVAEWPDETTGAVRTVTRKEIVKGVYGRLSIRPYSTDKRILIALANTEGSIGDAVHHGWTLDELRSAIATLTEIADALGETP